MSEIELIKQLRDRTGAGLMDCKKALASTNQDLNKAIDYLREKGIAKQVNKAATRIAAEGLAWVVTNDTTAAILEINSETDFVANSEVFRDLVKQVANILLENKPKDMDSAKKAKCKKCKKSVEELFVDAGVKLGEKLDFRRFQIVNKTKTQSFGPYIHMKGKIAVLTVLEGGSSEVANQVSLVVCSNSPSYAKESDIPQEVIDKETAIQKELSLQEPSFAKKPVDIQDKIIKGRVTKSLFEGVLSDMGLIGEEDKKVSQYLSENKAELVSYIRYEVGEGIEKRVDDFAAEVAAQANSK